MSFKADIDIDVSDRTQLLSFIKHKRASIISNNTRTKHNTGIYVQDIPVDHNNTSSIDYKTAEELGYFKIDFLNNSVYASVKSKDDVKRLISIEPLWELLEDFDFVSKLFHLNGHERIVMQMRPQSVEQLAAVLAIIRPSKRYLIGKDWDTVMKEVWVKPHDDEYFFKKSHSISYAMVIVLQMNLICEEIAINSI